VAEAILREILKSSISPPIYCSNLSISAKLELLVLQYASCALLDGQEEKKNYSVGENVSKNTILAHYHSLCQY
jgi:hypothetical protein